MKLGRTTTNNFLKVKFLTLFLITFIAYNSFSQTTADTGKIEVIADKRINELVETHKTLNTKAAIKGYRIKIHFGSDKNKAKEVKAKFITLHPTIPAYEKYDQPNFNIRVGDFRTKLEAYKFLKEIQIEFPSSFLVQDDIELPTF